MMMEASWMLTVQLSVQRLLLLPLSLLRLLLRHLPQLLKWLQQSRWMKMQTGWSFRVAFRSITRSRSQMI